MEASKPGARPILLLHGFTGSSESWGSEILSVLSASRPTLALDLPGHGGSPDPPEGADSGIPALCDRLVRKLDEQGIEAADWVGYSMGGRIALAAALRHPERVRRLVLESASPGIEDAELRAARRLEDEELARRIEREGVEWFADFWSSRPLFASQERLPVAVREALRARRLRNRPSGLAGALRTLGVGAQPSYWGGLPALLRPALLLTGALDRKFVEIGERMAERLPAATHRSVPGVGHAVHLEGPEAWLSAVISFLE